MAISTGAAIIGGSIISGVLGSRAARDAGRAAQSGADAATAESARQFDIVRGDTEPYRRVGVSAVERLNRLYGLDGASPDLSVFTESPGYRFNLAEGESAINRSLAARGRVLSGQGVKEGVRYASGMASNEFGNFYNRLANLAGLGQAGVNTSASAGMTTATNIGNANIAAGNARASAYMQGAGAINNAVQGGISNYLLNRYLNS